MHTRSILHLQKMIVSPLTALVPLWYLHFNLLSTSPEFLLTKTNSYTVSQYLMTNLESSVVVQELEFAINLALYDLL